MPPAGFNEVKDEVISTVFCLPDETYGAL